MRAYGGTGYARIFWLKDGGKRRLGEKELLFCYKTSLKYQINDTFVNQFKEIYLQQFLK
jgi:hypothetical protein